MVVDKDKLTIIAYMVVFLFVGLQVITPFYTADEYECNWLKCSFKKYHDTDFCTPIIRDSTGGINESFINKGEYIDIRGNKTQ